MLPTKNRSHFKQRLQQRTTTAADFNQRLQQRIREGVGQLSLKSFRHPLSTLWSRRMWGGLVFLTIVYSLVVLPIYIAFGVVFGSSSGASGSVGASGTL